MNAVFKQLGFAENPTFKDVFSAERSKKVVIHYWDKMVEGNSLLLFAYSLTPKDLLNQVLLANSKLKAKEALYRIGLLLAAREGNGMRELRTILSKRVDDRTWYRLVADMRETTISLDKLKLREWYDQVKQALERYIPYRIDSR